MGLDLITQRSCQVKNQIPQNQLLNQIKSRDQANLVFNMLIQNGKSRDEALATVFTKSIQTAEGIQNIQVKVSDLINNTSHLESVGAMCMNCPISQNKHFGCVGYVSYPISLKCEAWLAQLATGAYHKGMPYSAMLVFIKDQQITGNRMKQMRAQGQTFFESSIPQQIKPGSAENASDIITSDQMLEMTFLHGIMKGTHMNYLLMLFGGVVTDQEKPEDRPYSYDNEQNKYLYLDLHLPEDHDKSMLELYRFFQHLFVALVNGHDVWMD